MPLGGPLGEHGLDALRAAQHVSALVGSFGLTDLDQRGGITQDVQGLGVGRAKLLDVVARLRPQRPTRRSARP